MFARMIGRDFARNRSVTVLLVVLMMLSVVLATASAGTLVRLSGASSSLMTQADAPHVVQLHAGPYDQRAVDRWTAERPEVAHHQTMLMLGIDGANLFFDGVPQTTNIQQNSWWCPTVSATCCWTWTISRSLRLCRALWSCRCITSWRSA